MNKLDDDIDYFFKEMRKQDDQVLIPEFEDLIEKKQHSKRRYIIPLGVAASILMLLIFYFSIERISDMPKSEELVIIVSEKEELSTESLLVSESTIDSWESPSSSLIDDFNKW